MEKQQASSRQVRRYSHHFKQKVVEEIETGRCSIDSVARKYGIKGTMTLRRWIKQMGKNHLLCQVVRIETPQEMDEKVLLRQRIKDLEKGLVQTQLNCLQAEGYLALACQDLGMEVDLFKKKSTRKPELVSAGGSTKS